MLRVLCVQSIYFVWHKLWHLESPAAHSVHVSAQAEGAVVSSNVSSKIIEYTVRKEPMLLATMNDNESVNINKKTISKRILKKYLFILFI